MESGVMEIYCICIEIRKCSPLNKNDEIQFDREMMQFFESNLLNFGKLESYEDAMKSLDKYGGSWNSRLRFNR